MTLLALPGAACAPRASSARSKPGRWNPPARPSAPAFNVSRRVRPSQNLRRLPSMVIIARPSPR